MIEPANQRLGGAGDVAVVNQISLGRIDRPLNHHVKAKRMPVQPAAFVVGRERRQMVSRLKVKLLGEPDSHGDKAILGAPGRPSNHVRQSAKDLEFV